MVPENFDMGEHIILATLTIGYNDSPPNFKFFVSNSKLSLRKQVTSVQDLKNVEPLCLTFDNNCNNDWSLRSCRTVHPIPIFINKDAKFNKLRIRGFLNGEYYNYETILDSIDSVEEALLDHDMECVEDFDDPFDTEDGDIKIFKHAKTLMFEIL